MILVCNLLSIRAMLNTVQYSSCVYCVLCMLWCVTVSTPAMSGVRPHWPTPSPSDAPLISTLTTLTTLTTTATLRSHSQYYNITTSLHRQTVTPWEVMYFSISWVLMLPLVSGGHSRPPKLWWWVQSSDRRQLNVGRWWQQQTRRSPAIRRLGALLPPSLNDITVKVHKEKHTRCFEEPNISNKVYLLLQ